MTLSDELRLQITLQSYGLRFTAFDGTSATATAEKRKAIFRRVLTESGLGEEFAHEFRLAYGEAV